MRTSTRPPTVQIPTLSPVIGKAVFAIHQDPSTEPKPLRTTARSRSPVPVSQRKPWGANSNTPLKNVVPTSPGRHEQHISGTQPRKVAPRQPSPVPTPKDHQQHQLQSATIVTAATDNSSAIFHRLSAVENENKLLRSLVLELSSQINEIKKGMHEAKEVQDSRLADIAARTNYVVGWVDHFNGLVSKEEEGSAVVTESNSPDVARTLMMEESPPINPVY